MNGCTEIGKPQISILMAVYEPRMDWLREQLLSLDSQTYPNIKLYIRDDCSPTVPFDNILSCVQDCIHAFPYQIVRNEQNLGSNGTFELLTAEADGEYFAYCDQDDIWLPEKLDRLAENMAEADTLLVCSDMYIIDGRGARTADSITQVRKHHIFRSGKGLAAGLLISNFVTGCTMLIRAETARQATPFCPYMVHDQYLALVSATKGQILSLSECLIQYRIHGNNQTLSMAGVKDKASYLEVRINKLIRCLSWLQERFCKNEALSEEIHLALLWATARHRNFNKSFCAKRTIWKYRRFSPMTSLFEIFMAGTPNRIFMWVIELKRKNIL
jgi:glycosyltransferase involved in cell wall biosynthesis